MTFLDSLAGKAKLLRNLFIRRIYVAPKTEAELVSRFQDLYWTHRLLDRTLHSTKWLGVPAIKCPFDLWVYQEIIVELKPDLIIETGTKHGGSALFLASMCDLLQHGRVVSIDIDPGNGRPQHPRVQYLLGSSTAPAIIDRVRAEIRPEDRVLVILDSDHERDHVLTEMRLYAPLVSSGSYMIVEDTSVNGHPVMPEHGPGPWEAVDMFLRESKAFVPDPGCERHLMTFNPRGFLRKSN